MHLPYSINSPETFWAAANALATFAAVAVALILPAAGAWLAAKRRRKHALQYLDALGSELRWIDEKAETLIQRARNDLSKQRGPIGHGISIGWSVEDYTLAAIDDFVAISFPTYTLAAPSLADGPGDLGEIVAFGYGQLYRAKAAAETVRNRVQGKLPSADDLRAYDRAAGSALAAARRTYRLLGSFVELEVPEHWEPKVQSS